MTSEFDQVVQGARHMDGITSARSPEEALHQVLEVLGVRPEGQDAQGNEVFAGTSYRPPWGRIFGGQVLAQSLDAATRTVPDDRPAHSLHGYFLRPGDPEEPITFVVERLRDGRSFSARRTQAVQRGKPILSMISSFQTPGEGLEHQTRMPDVPGPDEIPSLEDRFGNLEIPEVQQMLRSRPIDLRHVEGPLYVTPGPERVAHQAVWMRPGGKLPDEPRVHTDLLAFASDYTLLESILRRHGVTLATPGMRMASLDHAMWFHRPFRFDDWVLYVQESPSASGARGLGLGRFFSRDGALIASTAQEGMIRLPRD